MMSDIVDYYDTLAYPSEGEYKEKGSKFLAYAYPFDVENQLDLILSELKSKHPKARHSCYAYKLGIDDNKFRINDDGEPSGTAGKPIYGQILSANLTNVIIVVIRYFGGTKLGASGLINAYKEASKEAIRNGEIITKYIYVTYYLTFGYDHMGHILNVIKDLEIEIIDKAFEADCKVQINIRHSEESKTIHQMKARLLGKSMEEVSVETEIDFCEIYT